MHEYSIVQSLLDSCEEHAAATKAEHVSKVLVKIVVLRGVEPELLKTAFDTFKEESICASAEFIMNIQPIVIECKDCSAQSTLKKLEYSCPKCQSVELDVIDGEDMYLMQLELE